MTQQLPGIITANMIVEALRPIVKDRMVHPGASRTHIVLLTEEQWAEIDAIHSAIHDGTPLSTIEFDPNTPF